MSSSDVVNGFMTAMLDHGITPPDTVIGDSSLHRFYVEGDRKGTLNGAYTLHLDARPSGWAMHFRTGVSFTWRRSGKQEPITSEMRRQIDYAKEIRAKEQAEIQAKVAQKASWIWEKAKPIARQADHPYLANKRIPPRGLRLFNWALVIPLLDETGALCNLQFIQSDGEKRFLSGGRKKGCYSAIGYITPTILICEGWASGASLYESTGHYVVVAMDAGNLEPVAKVIRAKYPDNKIILCADHDPVGIEKATTAAIACNGLMIAPPNVGMDFNDFINSGGVVYG